MGGREPAEWERAGWSRPPRNGREWKQLRAGKSEPGAQVSACKRCKTVNWTLDQKDGRTYRRCRTCQKASETRYRKRHRERRNAERRQARAKSLAVLRNTTPDRSTIIHISADCVASHAAAAFALAERGQILVLCKYKLGTAAIIPMDRFLQLVELLGWTYEDELDDSCKED